MKRILSFIIGCLACVGLQLAYAVGSPLGYWKTIDDVTGKPKSIIRISLRGNTLSGQIQKIFPRPGYDQNEVCSACKGALHNQRIVGMVILHGLKQEMNHLDTWSGGKILDPLNGKTYNCYIKVNENSSRLTVRGYIGLPLLGRTQTWIRVSGPQG